MIPEAVTANSKGYLLVNNDPILWAMLNAIKEQQSLINKQQNQIKLQQAQAQLQRGQIARLASQVRTMQASLRAGGPSNGQVRTAKAQMVVVH